MIIRSTENPIITTNDVHPSAEGLKVIGAFNPGACQLGDEIILLIRVAEACEQEKGWVKTPVIRNDNGGYRMQILSWKMNGRHSIDISDPREYLIDGKRYLSSLSHLRIARSTDGVHFTVDEKPFIFPDAANELFGVEDPRISQIGDTYYITYTAVSGDGYGVELASTKDFIRFERYGMIFSAPNKDACLFPEKIGEYYCALHRPTTELFGKPSIWYAKSPDLIHWGDHSCILRPVENDWEVEKIGAGPQPIKTAAGWLLLYHGCGRDSVYSLSLCLLDAEDPRRVLKRNAAPLITPTDPWEIRGFFPNVVFSNGWVQTLDGYVRIYYGAADKSICLIEATIEDLLNSLG